MATAFTSTVRIRKPASEVWDVLTDWERAPAWMPGVESASVEGDTLRFRSRGRDQRSTIHGDGPRRVRLRSQQGAVTADYTFEVADGPDATAEITLVADVVAAGPLRLVAPLLRLVIRRTDGAQLERLRAVIEG